MHGRIVFPIHNRLNQVIGYAGRAIDGADPKYVFPPGFRKSLELYNFNRLSEQSQSVVVVEGFFDCLQLWQAGAQNVVSLMGCSLSETQERILVSFPLVTLMLDGDEPGRAATRDITARLAVHPIYLRVIHLKPGEQPDSLTPETIKQLLA